MSGKLSRGQAIKILERRREHLERRTLAAKLVEKPYRRDAKEIKRSISPLHLKRSEPFQAPPAILRLLETGALKVTQKTCVEALKILLRKTHELEERIRALESNRR